jgi:diguanylate cyclase (GGDEF)-like protein/PAS domain S-box-containing protein
MSLRVLAAAVKGAASLVATLEASVGTDRPSVQGVRATPGSGSEARLHTLLARAADGFVVMDASNGITYLSEGLTDVLGARADLCGTDFIELVHPEDASAIRAALAAVVAREGVMTFEFRAEHMDGTWRWFEARAANLLADESVAGVAMLVRDASERKAIESDLRHRALHDTLTGLPNRTLLEDRLRGAIGRSGRDGRTVTVFFVDLDDFKAVNDSLGHAAGDDVLTGVGGRLAAVARAQDTVARFGGDEFVVVVEHDRPPEWVKDLAERLRAVFREPIQAGRHLLPMTASFGVASACGGNPSPESLLRDADAAMYTVKQTGGDNYAVFDNAMIDDQFVDLTVD